MATTPITAVSTTATSTATTVIIAITKTIANEYRLSAQTDYANGGAERWYSARLLHRQIDVDAGAYTHTYTQNYILTKRMRITREAKCRTCGPTPSGSVERRKARRKGQFAKLAEK